MGLKEILSPHNAELLAEAEMTTVDDVLREGKDALVAINGIGPKTAEDIYATCLAAAEEDGADPGADPVASEPAADGPTIEEATEAAEADQERLDEIVPVIAAGMTPRLYHPTMRFRDEWELAEAAVRISKAVLTRLREA